MLRRISGPKREETTGEWKKLHNEELHNLTDWLTDSTEHSPSYDNHKIPCIL
jgi:hypothetical protein